MQHHTPHDLNTARQNPNPHHCFHRFHTADIIFWANLIQSALAHLEQSRGYGLDDPALNALQMPIFLFSKMAAAAIGPIQPPTVWLSRLPSRGVKRLGHEIDNWALYSAVSMPLLPLHDCMACTGTISPPYGYHNFTPNISKIHYNVIFPSMTTLEEWSCSFEFLHKNSEHISHVPTHVAYSSATHK